MDDLLSLSRRGPLATKALPQMTTHHTDSPSRPPDEHSSYEEDNWPHMLPLSVGLQEAVEIARRSKDANSASEQITQVARERWRRQGPMADDITAVVVSLNS